MNVNSEEARQLIETPFDVLGFSENLTEDAVPVEIGSLVQYSTKFSDRADNHGPK